MIFSTATCPICEAPLKKEEVYEDAQYISIKTLYVCEVKLPFVDWLATPRNVHHYIYRIDRSNVSMLFPPYGLEHTDSRSLLFLISDIDSPKYIAELPLLDMDYTDTEAVLQKLHTLTTFS